jgi:hypothetical protein
MSATNVIRMAGTFHLGIRFSVKGPIATSPKA